MKVELADGEDPEEVIKVYQAKAESLVEDHKQHILASLKQLHLMAQYERKVASLEDSIKYAQEDLEDLRRKQATLLPGPSEEELDF